MQGPVRPPRGWAPEAELAGPRGTAKGLGPRGRVGQGPERPPAGWAPDAEWGRAPCGHREAGPQKPSGSAPRASAVWLGPRCRVWQGPVRPA